MTAAAEQVHDLPEHGVVLDPQHPWPGLASFAEHNRHYFRGREADADEVVRLVESSLVTVIYGLAGLGKTSLLQAGVFPRLRETNWLPVPVRLDFDDETTLVDQVFEALAREIPSSPERRGNETLWEYFHRSDVVFWNERHRVARPLLVFDQFEELFTIGKDTAAGRADFIAQLTDLAAGRPSEAVIARLAADAEESARFDPSRHRYGVVLSLREDYLAELDALRALYPGVDAVRKRVTKMNGGNALAVVEAGKDLTDPGTARSIVRFVATGDPDSRQPFDEMEVDPALLSVVCAELNNKRFAVTPPMPTINRGLLDQNRDSILADFYASAMKAFEDRPGVRMLVEDGLLTPHGYRASMSEDQAEAQFSVGASLITELVNHRLVRVETRGRARRIELTHDLLTHVIRESRDRRRDVEKQIAEAGRAEAERREQKVRGKLRRRNLWLVLAVVLGLVAVASYIQVVSERRKAARASGQWATRLAVDYINQDRPADALAYLAHAMRSDSENVIARRLAFDLMLSRMWYVVRHVWDHTNVRWLRISNDGRRLLTMDGTSVFVRTLPDGEAVPFAFDKLTAASLVGQGDRMVTASGNRMTVWNVGDASKPLAQWDEQFEVTEFWFSQDGSLIAVIAGETLVVRELSGAGRFQIPFPRAQQMWIQFSPDNSRIAVASHLMNEGRLEATVRETAAGAQIGSTIVKPFRPNDFEIDQNATYLVVAHKNGITTEPLTGGAAPHTLSNRTASDIALRPDGRALLAVIEGRVHVGSLENGNAPTELFEASVPFGNRISYAFFTLDGLRVATNAYSGHLQVWTPEGEPLSPAMAAGDVSAISADGRQVAVGTDKTVSLLVTPGLMQLATPAAWADMPANEESLFLWDRRFAEVLDPSSGRRRLNEKVLAGGIWVPPELNLLFLVPSLEGNQEPWRILDPVTGKRTEFEALPRGKLPPYLWSASGDGKRVLYTHAEPFTAWLHDVTTGKLVKQFNELPDHGTPIVSTALSFDGSRAAFVAKSGTLTIIDVATGNSKMSSDLGLWMVGFSRDGKLLIGRNSWYLWFLDPQTLNQATWPPPDNATVNFAELSDDKDGKYLVTGSRDGNARVRLLETMKQVGEPQRHLSPMISANFNAGGTRFATSTEGDIHVVWDTASGLPVTAPHQSVDTMSVWLGAKGRRFPLVDRSGLAKVIELPEGTEEEVELLAELAEHLAGFRFHESTRELITAPMKIEIPKRASDAARLVEAFQATDNKRRLTPFTDTTLEAFVKARLESAGDDRENVARKLAMVYPGAVQ